MEKRKLEIEVGIKDSAKEKESGKLSVIPTIYIGEATSGEKTFTLAQTWNNASLVITDKQTGNQFITGFSELLEALGEAELI